MRKKKFAEPLFADSNLLVVEPNNSLTPRQILQQYSSGVATSFHEPSDVIDDDSYSDDDMVDKVITFEDEMEAYDFMHQPASVVNEPEPDNQQASGEGSDVAPGEE